MTGKSLLEICNVILSPGLKLSRCFLEKRNRVGISCFDRVAWPRSFNSSPQPPHKPGTRKYLKISCQNIASLQSLS
jgi:hypothetical protein